MDSTEYHLVDLPAAQDRLDTLLLEMNKGFPLYTEVSDYPDGWTDLPNASDSNRYKALGNSVAIPCVQYLIQRIAMCLVLGFQGYF